jgi:hypothetical protein
MSIRRIAVTGFSLVAFDGGALAAEIRMRATGTVQHTLIERAQSFASLSEISSHPPRSALAWSIVSRSLENVTSDCPDCVS